eukprot:6200647-Pleurochrysis_carterae.AAC.1
MEFVEGGHMQDRLTRQGRYEEVKGKVVVRQARPTRRVKWAVHVRSESSLRAQWHDGGRSGGGGDGG